ncbi:MAG: GDP-mannose 4,6-dehydratase [Blastocatellia bacterium]|nr:GDP-mannose 4,6-dehydratase [Blastocatellia bacterium]
MNLKGKQILVTGGAGFIGSHLVDRLLAEAPAKVVVIDNFDEFYDPQIKLSNISDHVKRQAYRLVRADIRDYEALKRIFAENHFDAIIHLAAKAGVRPSVSEPRVYTEVNINGTVNLLELAERNGVRKFVFGSSSSVYGPAATPPFREDAPLAPISPYASTKASGELLAHAYSHLYGMQVVCLRFFTVYGARQRPDLAIHKFARMITSRNPIPVYGDGSAERDFTYIDDILQGVMAAIEYNGSPFEVFNLGESQTVTVNRMIELLEEALDRKAIIERRPPQPGDMPLTHADITKARKLLSYQPTTAIETGIKKFAEWFKRG